MAMVYNVTVRGVGTQASVGGTSGDENAGSYSLHLTREQFGTLQGSTATRFDLKGSKVGGVTFEATLLRLQGAGTNPDTYVFAP